VDVSDPSTIQQPSPRRSEQEKVPFDMMNPPVEWLGYDNKHVQQSCNCERKSQQSSPSPTHVCFASYGSFISTATTTLWSYHTALKKAGVHYRWHDLRHTFISRLAESPAVSEQTIKALAGHVSKQMLERYSHIRTRAKEQAIAALHASRSQISAGVGPKVGTVRREADGRENLSD